MTAREQKSIFTFAVLFMFSGFLWSIVSCPPPLAHELPLVFAIGVAQTLLPAFALLSMARIASKL